MPSHSLNQCWVIVNWTPRNKLQWNFNQNTKIFIHKIISEIVIWGMMVILSQAWTQWSACCWWHAQIHCGKCFHVIMTSCMRISSMLMVLSDNKMNSYGTHCTNLIKSISTKINNTNKPVGCQLFLTSLAQEKILLSLIQWHASAMNHKSYCSCLNASIDNNTINKFLFLWAFGHKIVICQFINIKHKLIFILCAAQICKANQWTIA